MDKLLSEKVLAKESDQELRAVCSRHVPLQCQNQNKFSCSEGSTQGVKTSNGTSAITRLLHKPHTNNPFLN